MARKRTDDTVKEEGRDEARTLERQDSATTLSNPSTTTHETMKSLHVAASPGTAIPRASKALMEANRRAALLLLAGAPV